MAGIDSLDTLLREELKDIYDAEKQLTKALPKMVKKAADEELKAAFETHLQQTRRHLERLERVFEALGIPARGKKCTGMQNLLKEGEEMIAEAEDEATRDAIMIAAAQKVEHYEIAAYGTLRVWANVLGHTEAAGILEETLDEEKKTDQRLTQIAEASVNQASAEEGDREEDESRPPRRMRAARSGSARGRQQAADRPRGGTAGANRSRSRSR